MVSQAVANLRQSIYAKTPVPGARSPRTREEIAGVATIIAEQFRPHRILLFGSHAYGTPSADSDVDFMVVMDTPVKPTEQAARIRQAIGRVYRFPMDIVVRRPDQIALGLAEGDFFIVDIVEQGASLFEAGDAELDR